jgi:enamidase
VSGDWRLPFVEGDTVICENGRIAFVGKDDTRRVSKADVVIDVNGATATPGLIDSHVHTTFNDYTPRQVCTAGNLRTTILCANLARDLSVFDRFIIATDTPTGSGTMPLGMFYTISHCASLTDMPAELFVCAATGSNARVYRLNSGLLAQGRDADIILIGAPSGGSQETALAAIKNGDVPAVSAVVTAGVPRFVGRSRNTPAGTRQVRIASSRVPADFSG